MGPSRQAVVGPPATFANHAENGFRLTAMCRSCWHQGPTRTPAEWAAALGVRMDSGIIASQRRLVCSACGQRTAYFHIEYPNVRPHT